MSTPALYAPQVQTYADASLAQFENMTPIYGSMNKKLKEFENLPAQLGTTVNVEIPFQALTTVGLVAKPQSFKMRFSPLTVDQAFNVSHQFNSKQFIYTVEQYMQKLGRTKVVTLASTIEATLGKNFHSAMPVMIEDPTNPNNIIPSGALHTESGPFRFYGDGKTAINSFDQLAEMEANFVEFGVPPGQIVNVIPNRARVGIISSGLNQFVTKRNDEFANSWDLGNYTGSNVQYLTSNLLSKHISGTAGNDNNTYKLEVVSVTNTTDAVTGIVTTQITFTGAGGALPTDANMVKSGDVGYFLDPTLNYLTYTDAQECLVPVQIRSMSDAASSGGNVTVTCSYPLISDRTIVGCTVNKPIVAGMEFKFMPSHLAGCMYVADFAMLGQPELDDQEPFATGIAKDEQTGATLRHYYGTQLGQSAKLYVHDNMFGALWLQIAAMRILYPLNQFSQV